MPPDPIATQAEHREVTRCPWRALVVGDADRDEFGPTWDWLTARMRWQQVDTIREAVDLLEAGEVPQILVLAKSRPGQYSTDQLDRVRRVAPLIRIVVVRGAWCEGETCSGQPLPGTWRLAWHQSVPRLEAEWVRYQQGLSPMWELAPTAGEDDLALRPPLQWSVRGSILIEIVAPDSPLADGFRVACRSLGLATRWHDPRDGKQRTRFASHRADLYLCLVTGQRDFAAFDALNRRDGEAPVIALLSFPRWHDYVAARQAGVAAVISLPVVADVLQIAIAKALPDRLSLWPQSARWCPRFSVSAAPSG